MKRTRIAGLLAIIGLGLLLASFVPWPVDVGEGEASQPAEVEAISLVDRGRALFVAKGCATCHAHDALVGLAGETSVGPDLSSYQPNAEFVRRWLGDPAAIRPDTPMPDLALSDGEITALIAFLTAAAAGQDPADVALTPESCPVTRPPDQPFIPPGPILSKEDERLPAEPLGSFEGLFWYGSQSLWTQLPVDGVWWGLPHNERGYTQKLFFSRAGYNWRQEPQPALTVSGRRLDDPGPTFTLSDATNGFHPDVGSFMLVGVDIPAPGCWEITGRYEGHELSFVVWIEPA